MSGFFGTRRDSAPGHLALVPPIPAPEIVVVQEGRRLVPRVEQVVVFVNDQPPEVCDVSAAADGTKSPRFFRRELNA